jgi:hypothetical protein
MFITVVKVEITDQGDQLSLEVGKFCEGGRLESWEVRFSQIGKNEWGEDSREAQRQR